MILYGYVVDWFTRQHVKRNTHISEEIMFTPSVWQIVGAKLKTDDGNSLGNLHASRKLKVIFLVALQQV